MRGLHDLRVTMCRLKYGYSKELGKTNVRRLFEGRGFTVSYSFANTTNDGVTQETQETVAQRPQKRGASPRRAEVVRAR